MSKQDGYSSRTAVDLERKYNFGKTFAEVYNLVSDARKAAQEAQNAFDGLNQDQIFNILTNYGEWEGIYRDDNGDVYVNASYIKGGKILAGQVQMDAANITGQLVATQIDTKDLKVLAANITGTLSAGQIDATNLTVDAANITGDLTASSLIGSEVALLTYAGRTAGGLGITGASSGDFAIELHSNGAIRLEAYSGAAWMGSGYASFQAYGSAATMLGGSAGIECSDYVWIGSNMFPNRGSAYLCGNANFPWSGVWSTNGMCETSDRNKKKDIAYGLDKMDGFFDDLKPSEYRMVKGTSGRKHIGFVAQDIRDNLDKHGISTADFGGYVEDKDEDGNPVYALRYSEFIALLVEQVQKLKARVAELEENKHGKK